MWHVLSQLRFMLPTCSQRRNEQSVSQRRTRRLLSAACPCPPPPADSQEIVAARCRWEQSSARYREGLFFARAPFGSVERVRLFAQQVMSGELNRFQHVRTGESPVINHAYPQCHYFCGAHHLMHNRSSWLFVGRLESYARDVGRLVDALGFRQRREALIHSALHGEASFLKQYPRSKDNRTRNALAMAVAAKAFYTDEATRHAVCHILSVDYACVNALLPEEDRYTPPAECRGIAPGM